MAEAPSSNRSISIEGSVKGAAFVQGDHNVTNITNVFQAAAAVETPAKATGANPYLGLLPFTEDDADRFFGREALVEEYYARFRDLNAGPFDGSRHRLLAILGPSGSGKSSLARAGLFAKLRREPLGGGPLGIMTPGAKPLEALAIVLARIAAESANAPGQKDIYLEALNTPDKDGAYDGLRRIAADIVDPARKPLVLLIDQFEEIYTSRNAENPDRSDEERKRFVETILQAARDPDGKVSLILTMRSDFLGATQADGALSTVINSRDAVAMVPAMSRDGLRRAIALPAKKAGMELDENTITRLVNETDGYDGALPLLQFVLVLAWQGMAAGQAAADVVERLGGVGGALGTEAEKLYQSLHPTEGEQPGPAAGPGRKPNERLIAQRAFLGMVRITENDRPTRRRAPIARLVADDPDVDDDIEFEEARGVLEKFADPLRRMVTLRDEGGVQTVEVTHEALIQHWGRLKTWLAESKADRPLHDRLADAAELWRKGQGSSWRPPELDHLRTLAAKPMAGLTADERAFFKESVAAHDKELRLKRRREWFVRIAAVVSLMLAVAAFWQKTKADGAIETAGDATNNISHTLVNQLSGVEGAQDARNNLHDVVRHVENLLTPGGGQNASRGVFWDHIIKARDAGERAKAAGQNERARAALDLAREEHAKAALDLAREMTRRSPGNLEWRRNLVIALQDSAPRGPPESTPALETAVEISRDLLKTAKSGPYAAVLHHYRHDLMSSLRLMGDQNYSTGKTLAAAGNYREALDIADTLNKTQPQNRTYQFQTASLHQAYAGTLRGMQKFDLAYPHAFMATTMLASLNRADHANADWAAALIDARRDLAGVHLERYGKSRDSAYLTTARAESDAAMRLANDRQAVQPDRLQWQLLMLKLDTQRADIELKAGNPAAARRQAIAATERAARLQSVNDAPAWRSTFAWAYNRLAIVELSDRDFAAARTASASALRIARQPPDPAAGDNPQFDLIAMLGKRGEIEWHAEGWPAAAAFIREALQVADALSKGRYKEDPGLKDSLKRLRGCERDIALQKAPGSVKC